MTQSILSRIGKHISNSKSHTGHIWISTSCTESTEAGDEDTVEGGVVDGVAACRWGRHWSSSLRMGSSVLSV